MLRLSERQHGINRFGIEHDVWLPRTPAALLQLLFLVGMLGCGASDGLTRVAVEGEVLLDGIPLAEGMIRFVPMEGVSGPAAVGRVEEGRFSLRRSEGPVPGRHRVEIEATGYHDFAIDDEQAYAEAFGRRPRDPLGKNPVPVAYNERSELTADVAPPGPRQFTFTLSSGSGR